jgi:predicted DNA-binding transcriptional regulator AlpA
MKQEIDKALRLVRVREIIKPNGILPICRSSFYNLVKSGIISPGVRLGPRVRAWRVSEIEALVTALEVTGEADV